MARMAGLDFADGRPVGVISKRVVHGFASPSSLADPRCCSLLSTKFAPTFDLKAQQHGTKDECFNEWNSPSTCPELTI